MDVSVLTKLDAQKDHLVLSGFPPKYLEDISRRMSSYKGGEQSREELESQKRWTVVPDAGANTPDRNAYFFREVCEMKRVLNVHWFQCHGVGDNVTVSWKRTAGSEAAVAPFVRLASDTCTRAPTCVHAPEAARDVAAWEQKAGLLVGQPGIGKTQFLKRLAAEARVRAPGRWAVFVQALAHRHLLQKLPQPKDLDMKHVVELLVAAAAGPAAPASSGADALRLCLEAALFRTGAIDVYVDGVDEVCPSFKDKLVRLLELMLDTRVQRVWVTSRPEVEVLLSQSLRCQTTSLHPFSKAEQKSYLCKHWSSTSNAAPSEFEGLAHEMVEALHSAAGHGNKRSLLDVPLHAQMAAEAYAERAREVLKTGIPLLPSSRITLLELYRDFVEKKRDLYRERYGLNDPNFTNISILDNFDEVHENIAMFVLVANDDFENVDSAPFQDYFDKMKNNLSKEKTGIVWLGETGTPQFIHHTFVEFFAASWMLSQVGKTSDKATLWRSLLKTTIDSGVRSILEHMLAEGLPLHEAVLEHNEQALETALATSDPNECDEFGRLALHVAASLGRADAVGALLAKGSDLGRRDSVLGWTALRYCTQPHQLEAAERLLQAGADCADLCVDDIEETAFIVAERGFLGVMKRLLDIENNGITLLIKCERQFGYTLLQTSASRGRHKIMKFLIESGAYIPLQDRNRKSLLMYAVEGNNESSVRFLLQQGVDVNAVDEKLRTAIHYALLVRSDHEIIRLLLQRGADVNARDWEHKTPLMLAVEMRKLSIVRLLLNHGADLQSVDAVLRTPTHYAARGRRVDNVEKMRLLLDGGAPVDALDRSETTPLMLAAQTKSVSTARLLLEHGANLHAVDINLWTPIHYVTIECNNEEDEHCIEILELLVDRGANMEARDKTGRTALILAAEKRNVAMVRHLLEHGADVHAVDNNLWSTVHYVSYANNNEEEDCINILKLLLQYGANVDALGMNGTTPLMSATQRKSISTTRLRSEHGADMHMIERSFKPPVLYVGDIHKDDNNVEIIKFLLGRSANVNAQHTNGMTPLMIAAQSKDVSAACVLLDHGADVNSVDSILMTPTHYAANYCGDDVEIMKLLLGRGANVDAQDMKGRTPLMLATEKRSVSHVGLLLQHGANVHVVDKKLWAPINYIASVFNDAEADVEIVKLLLERGAYVDEPVKQVTTLLMLAVRKRNVSFVRLLLSHGADCNAVDSHGWGPIHYATNKWSSHDDDVEIMKFLLERGTNVEARVENDRTPLMLAAKMRNISFVQLLLKHGANVHAVDSDGWTPIHYAAKKWNSGDYDNDIEIIKLLLERGANAKTRVENDRTLLTLAAEGRNVSFVRLLLKHGADVHAVDSNGWTPIHYAAKKCNDGTDDVEILKLLLENGANVDVRGMKGRTPLMLAAERRNVSFVRLLLDRGSNVDAVDDNLWTPIQYVANIYEDDDDDDDADDDDDDAIKIMKLLVERGANVDVRDTEGRTTLMIVAGRKNVLLVLLLLEGGANVHAVDSNLWTPMHYTANVHNENDDIEIMKLLLEGGANVDARDIKERTPLMLAVEKRNVSRVKLLLERGADVNAVDSNRWTPMHYVANMYYDDDHTAEILELLLKSGADVDVQDIRARTPLMLAVERRNVSFVRLLSERGSNVDAVVSNHWNPTHYVPNVYDEDDDDDFC